MAAWERKKITFASAAKRIWKSRWECARRFAPMCCLRRARVNEVGFEIVNTDLESRYRLRRLLVDALNARRQNKDQEWSGDRKV